MDVKILGTGCSKCKALADKVRFLADEYKIDIDIEKITDFTKITEYGVMMTPGLIVDGVVKSAGKIPKDEDILRWLRGE